MDVQYNVGTPATIQGIGLEKSGDIIACGSSLCTRDPECVESVIKNRASPSLAGKLTHHDNLLLNDISSVISADMTFSPEAFSSDLDCHMQLQTSDQTAMDVKCQSSGVAALETGRAGKTSEINNNTKKIYKSEKENLDNCKFRNKNKKSDFKSASVEHLGFSLNEDLGSKNTSKKALSILAATGGQKSMQCSSDIIEQTEKISLEDSTPEIPHGDREPEKSCLGNYSMLSDRNGAKVTVKPLSYLKVCSDGETEGTLSCDSSSDILANHSTRPEIKQSSTFTQAKSTLCYAEDNGSKLPIQASDAKTSLRVETLTPDYDLSPMKQGPERLNQFSAEPMCYNPEDIFVDGEGQLDDEELYGLDLLHDSMECLSDSDDDLVSKGRGRPRSTPIKRPVKPPRIIAKVKDAGGQDPNKEMVPSVQAMFNTALHKGVGLNLGKDAGMKIPVTLEQTGLDPNQFCLKVCSSPHSLALPSTIQVPTTLGHQGTSISSHGCRLAEASDRGLDNTRPSVISPASSACTPFSTVTESTVVTDDPIQSKNNPSSTPTPPLTPASDSIGLSEPGIVSSPGAISNQLSIQVDGPIRFHTASHHRFSPCSQHAHAVREQMFLSPVNPPSFQPRLARRFTGNSDTCINLANGHENSQISEYVNPANLCGIKGPTVSSPSSHSVLGLSGAPVAIHQYNGKSRAEKSAPSSADSRSSQYNLEPSSVHVQNGAKSKEIRRVSTNSVCKGTSYHERNTLSVRNCCNETIGLPQVAITTPDIPAGYNQGKSSSLSQQARFLDWLETSEHILNSPAEAELLHTLPQFRNDKSHIQRGVYSHNHTSLENMDLPDSIDISEYISSADKESLEKIRCQGSSLDKYINPLVEQGECAIGSSSSLAAQSSDLAEQRSRQACSYAPLYVAAKEEQANSSQVSPSLPQVPANSSQASPSLIQLLANSSGASPCLPQQPANNSQASTSLKQLLANNSQANSSLIQLLANSSQASPSLIQLLANSSQASPSLIQLLANSSQASPSLIQPLANSSQASPALPRLLENSSQALPSLPLLPAPAGISHSDGKGELDLHLMEPLPAKTGHPSLPHQLDTVHHPAPSLIPYIAHLQAYGHQGHSQGTREQGPNFVHNLPASVDQLEMDSQPFGPEFVQPYKAQNLQPVHRPPVPSPMSNNNIELLVSDIISIEQTLRNQQAPSWLNPSITQAHSTVRGMMAPRDEPTHLANHLNGELVSLAENQGVSSPEMPNDVVSQASSVHSLSVVGRSGLGPSCMSSQVGGNPPPPPPDCVMDYNGILEILDRDEEMRSSSLTRLLGDPSDQTFDFPVDQNNSDIENILCRYPPDDSQALGADSTCHKQLKSQQLHYQQPQQEQQPWLQQQQQQQKSQQVLQLQHQQQDQVQECNEIHPQVKQHHQQQQKQSDMGLPNNTSLAGASDVSMPSAENMPASTSLDRHLEWIRQQQKEEEYLYSISMEKPLEFTLSGEKHKSRPITSSGAQLSPQCVSIATQQANQSQRQPNPQNSFPKLTKETLKAHQKALSQGKFSHQNVFSCTSRTSQSQTSHLANLKYQQPRQTSQAKPLGALGADIVVNTDLPQSKAVRKESTDDNQYQQQHMYLWMQQHQQFWEKQRQGQQEAKLRQQQLQKEQMLQQQNIMQEKAMKQHMQQGELRQPDKQQNHLRQQQQYQQLLIQQQQQQKQELRQKHLNGQHHLVKHTGHEKTSLLHPALQQQQFLKQQEEQQQQQARQGSSGLPQGSALLTRGFPDVVPSSATEPSTKSIHSAENEGNSDQRGTASKARDRSRLNTETRKSEVETRFNSGSDVVRRKAGDSDLSVLSLGDSLSTSGFSEGETVLHTLCYMDLPEEKLHTIAAPHLRYINHKSFSGETALFVAVKCCSLKVVRFLLSCHADPNIVCVSSTQDKGSRSETVEQTCLHEAVEAGSEEIVRILLSCDLIEVDALRPGSEITPLMLALDLHKGPTRRNIALMLRDHQASLFLKDSITGRTPLMFAIQSGDVGLVEDLLQKAGADAARKMVNQVNKRGLTCLHFAAQLKLPVDEKRHLLRAIILAGGDPSQRNNEGESAKDWDKPNVDLVLAQLKRA
ncbi:hypothetical protein PoB_003532800 [Plakobranchus ocellatus]|uniref:Uncharacterized protein n=1 Tax=Plakobranchus ocellatus TaxID=259542 RepID=A0AAV4APT8_9GAST|nr:hypothetical protein PoB_003532800 [Plakobranchus ocellatus]